MDGVKFYKKPKLKSPYLVVAWPGMGDVAFRAATYLIEKLRAEEFAEILPEEFFYFSGSEVRAGILEAPQLPRNKFYYWKNKSGKNDLIIFISNAQPDLTRAEEYSGRITAVAKAFRAKMVISFAAMLQQIEHTQSPNVWYVSSSKAVNEQLKKFNINHLKEGHISGMNGLFVGLAKKSGLAGFCLLGEIPLYAVHIDNPKASHAILAALARILGIELDFNDLIEQERNIEEEINRLLDYLKTGHSNGPIGDEDIEKIKHLLTQLTRLPHSIKDKIEKLFTCAKSDISKASELKAELDRWNVYKEYEDRFLDLFRKGREKNN
jgi:hypothetical protein